MKVQRVRCRAIRAEHDNFRVKRYIARVHDQPGESRMASRTKSVRSRSVSAADLVLWNPAFSA